MNKNNDRSVDGYDNLKAWHDRLLDGYGRLKAEYDKLKKEVQK